MDLEKALRKEHSKRQCNRLVAWTSASPKRFAELMQAFLGEDKLLAQRAGWPVSCCAEAHPELIRPWWPKLARAIAKPALHAAVTRNIFRLLQFVPIPQAYQGLIMTYCFEYIASPLQAPAVRAYGITILYQLSKTYPEISGELRSILEEQFPQSSAAFRSRARKILRQLQ